MSLISQILIQFANPSLIHMRPTSLIGFKGWIANQRYYVDNAESNIHFTLKAYELNDLNLSIANDCNRFFTASVESISGITKESKFPKTASWAVIRAYYAAFYSAHSLLRIFSNPCSNLEAEYIRKIIEISRITSTIINLSPPQGYYHILYNQDEKYLIFKKLNDSHADTWKTFKTLLNQLIDKIPTAKSTSKNKEKVFDLLVSLRESLCSHGCTGKGNWLSMLRNSVNYKLSHGIWFPYSGSNKINEELICDSTYWKGDPFINNKKISNSNDLKSFMYTCVLIISITKEILEALNEKSNSDNSIFKNTVIKSLNLSKAA